MSDAKIMKKVQIRTTHQYGYRSGEWASLVDIVTYLKDSDERPVECYFVRFPDGALDFWPVCNSGFEYEFKGLT